MQFLKTPCALLCASLLLIACGGGGGGGGGGGDSDGGVEKPTANAGGDQTVEMGTTVTLDGSASSSPNSGADISYTWTLARKPTNSDAELSDDTDERPTFVADQPGIYQAQLVVNDGTADSDQDRVTITATNPEPVAVARTQHNELVGTTVLLDGGESLPPTGGDANLLSYEWRLTETPDGSTATLADTGTALTSLYTDVAGTYTATLTVRYQAQTSEPLTVTIIAAEANARPVADAGGPYTVERGTTLTLDGGASSDANGNPLSYRWYMFTPNTESGDRVASIPRGSSLTVETALQDADTATPSITPDVVGTWTVYLVVHDGTSISDVSSADIEVTLPAGAANTPPVATWFPKPHVGFYTGRYSNEVELGVTTWASGNSYDVDGNRINSANRRYQWIATPDGYDAQDLSGSGSFSFTPSVEGDYTVQMIVNDGEADSAPEQRTFTARTGANSAPSAHIDVDSGTVLVGTPGWFDGRESSDPNDDRLEYIWTLFDKPDGSNAGLTYEDVTLQDGTVLNNARAGIVPDRPGMYIVMLAVRDSLGATNRPSSFQYGRLLVKSENNAPTVNLPGFRSSGVRTNPLYPYWGMDETQPAPTGISTTVLPQVVDPDFDDLYYLWTLDEQPAGSNLADAYTSENLTLIPTVPGDYRVTLVVSDGMDTSEPRSLTLRVADADAYPSLKLSPGGAYTGATVGMGDVPEDLATREMGNNSTVTFPYQSDDITTQGLTVMYKLTASGGDYTITDLEVSTAYGGTGQARLVGLSEGQVIREGESVNFALASPSDYSLLSSDADFRWSFNIKERDDWWFDYHYQREQLVIPGL
ncbi:PKD domain-containing protein [Alcanivorax sp. MM125-6]|nr:PKD domain-containing protein [Alcanivorax sp. MM125-6]